MKKILLTVALFIVLFGCTGGEKSAKDILHYLDQNNPIQNYEYKIVAEEETLGAGEEAVLKSVFEQYVDESYCSWYYVYNNGSKVPKDVWGVLVLKTKSNDVAQRSYDAMLDADKSDQAVCSSITITGCDLAQNCVNKITSEYGIIYGDRVLCKKGKYVLFADSFHLNNSNYERGMSKKMIETALKAFE